MGVCVLSWCYENSDVENTDLRHSQNSLFSNYNPPKYRLAKGCHWINFNSIFLILRRCDRVPNLCDILPRPISCTKYSKKLDGAKKFEVLAHKKEWAFPASSQCVCCFFAKFLCFSFRRGRTSAYLTSQLDFMRFVARCVYKQLMFFVK